MVAPVADIDGAERALGCRFSDRKLVAVALDPSRRGFSRLEFLGDAVLGIAVYVTAERLGLPRDLAAQAVCNDHLDHVFDQLLAPYAAQRTGDIVEALVGAVHLDAGFGAAASLAVGLCVPGGTWLPIDGSGAPGRIRPYRGDCLRSLAFQGRTVLNIVVADHLVTTRPDAPHRDLSTRRSKLLDTGTLAPIARSRGLATEASTDRRAVDELEAAVGTHFLAHGWTSTRASTQTLLGL